MDREIDYYIGFSVFPGIGPVRFSLLRNFFGSAQAAWKASVSALKEVGLGYKLVEEFIDFRQNFDIDKYQKKLTTDHIHCIPDFDQHYPALLHEIPDHPFVLYVKGKKSTTPWDLNKTIAIVGTRKVTEYGAEVTQNLASELCHNGCTIVSGLAYGVDAIAHQSALVSGGKTIAVLGCGVDIIAPPSNAHLYNRIVEGGGAVVSEMPLGLRPNKGIFPARNRIISGLSLGVVVTEGAVDSGSLITARYAAEQGREVFAVPGPITSVYSHGPAALLKQGAKLVTSAQDILDELGIQAKSLNDHSHKLQQLEMYLSQATSSEKTILTTLGSERIHIDQIVRLTHLTPGVVSATLSVLEIRGIVRDYGEKVYGI